MTNLNLYDKFVIIAKAFGNKIEPSSNSRRSSRTNEETLQPASFDAFSSFLGPI